MSAVEAAAGLQQFLVLRYHELKRRLVQRLGSDEVAFHLGGTNAKGYYLGASYAFDRKVWLTGRWMAAKEVSGAPLSIDVFQLEVNAGF